MIGDDPLDLQGQIAFVSGAGQGAGRAIALKLAHHNAGAVVVNDYVLQRAQAVVEEIENLGVSALAVASDVGNYESVCDNFSLAEQKLGPVSLLVNNAGNAGPGSKMGFSPLFWQTTPRDWQGFFQTNLTGVMNCCHRALPNMVEQNCGKIVTVISDAGRVGEPRLAAYAAAKAGAAGFMRALARETGRYNITCNCISLSTLEPALSEPEKSQYLESPQAKNQLARYTLRRFGRPDDVASMALFLCSDAASWITGQTYPVNGGYSVTQ